MKQTPLKLPVPESVERLKKSIEAKGFTVFADIDHQANAESVDLELPASRVLIFGNPVAGTKLMQKDISMSLDLPLRLAVVEKNQQTVLVHQTSEDYASLYQVKGHPVLEKVESLFETLASDLT